MVPNNIDESTEEVIASNTPDKKANAGINQAGSTTPKKRWLQHIYATCHSFNREIFNLHSLSYLEDDEITVSPRVVADVEHELEWIERWRNREFESRD